MSREQFEAYYNREQLPCLSSVKERHWQTWLEAQATLLSAHGPVVMLTMDDVVEMPGLPNAETKT